MIYKAHRTVFNSILIIILFSACSEQSNLSTELIAQKQIKSEIKKVVHHSELKLKPLLGQYFHSGSPFSGIAETFHNNNKKATLTEYTNGVKHGTIKKYFEDGSLSFSSNYINGKQHGETNSWWRNGNKRSTSNYDQGTPHGLQLQWYKSGNLFKKIHLNRGKEDGLQQSWRENGKLYNNYEAKNGRIFGLKRSQLCFKLENETLQISNEN